MKLIELKEEVQKYQYLEDTSIIDVSLATIIANRLKLGDPVWLIIIGASSGGKSQILRPLALTDEKFLHRVDDLTENTFLSGLRAKEGEKTSLLDRIGKQGMVVISDFTVIMSKSPETRASILSQFRMIYDGEMTKFSGNSPKPLKWEGYLGVLAGSTPSIYSHFEEVSDMGERFIYWRMKEFDQKKATELALSRKVFGRELDIKLSDLYAEYIKDVVQTCIDKTIVLPEEVTKRIIEVSMLAERVRTNAHKDWKGIVNKIPVSAMPMRIALQLTAIAKGLGAIKLYENGKMQFSEKDLSIIDWLGYSLANEENRACLKIMASIPFDYVLSTQTIADKINLDTNIAGIILQNLSAVGVLQREGGSGGLQWKFSKQSDYDIVRRIEHIEETIEIANRDVTVEEGDSYGVAVEDEFNSFGL
jgi:hypothetical protein